MEITFHTQLPSGHACQYGVDSKEGENQEEAKLQRRDARRRRDRKLRLKQADLVSQRKWNSADSRPRKLERQNMLANATCAGWG